MLFRALSVFALRDIDLTKIESRPMRSAPLLQPTATAASTAAAAAALGTAADAAGQQQVPPAVTGRSFNYLFYVDFRGCLADEAAQNALRHLQEFAPFLRVLGSYPADPEL
jgi:arogenate/prephenate dehydratase